MKTPIPQSFIVVLVVCLGSLQNGGAISPPPDGGYPNFTTAEGQNALKDLTTGAANTALGAYSLFSTTTGSFNTAVGAGALDLNTGDQNTAVGVAALLLNTGTNNTAVGVDALGLNSTGTTNTATGAFALYSNTTGSDNTATGNAALSVNTTGSSNTAIGSRALIFLSAADENTAVGFNALQVNTSGAGNTAVGALALINNSGDANVALGVNAGFDASTGSGNVYIGADVNGASGESNHTYIRNIKDISVSGGGTDFVTVDLTSGLLGHLSSSRRYKEEIKPMNNASEALFALKPVTYRYKKEIDGTQSRAFGLIAEEVAEVNPSLVAHNAQGQPESVHYEMVNAMLLNEFLKEHRKVEAQNRNAQEQQKEIDALRAELRQQKALIEKVSARLEVSKPAPQTVLNNQ